MSSQEMNIHEGVLTAIVPEMEQTSSLESLDLSGRSLREKESRQVDRQAPPLRSSAMFLYHPQIIMTLLLHQNTH